jgi:signal transduction histidine kinase
MAELAVRRRAPHDRRVTHALASEFRSSIGQRVEAAHHQLASRWLEHLTSLVPVDPNDIFPGEQLLGHAPTLIREIAAFLQAPAHESIAANAVVTARAAELGHLRHTQHASIHQVLREYRTLRSVITEFIAREIDELGLTPSPDELIDLMNRVDAAVEAVLQATIDTYVAEYTQAITQHAVRLEGFNRMVTHELRQPLGTLQFALRRLAAEDVWANAASRDRVLATAERNVQRMHDTLGKLLTLSRTAGSAESALVQRVELAAVVRDVVEQLREMADARGVEVRAATPLPAIEIDVARLELVLVNLVSNAIKYSDPAKPARVVEIAAVPGDNPRICTITVCDNGIGIAESDLRSIFARFYRGRSQRDRELGTSGLGLGLAIVAECVDALKGDIRVESTLGEGTTFFVELPVSPAV